MRLHCGRRTAEVYTLYRAFRRLRRLAANAAAHGLYRPSLAAVGRRVTFGRGVFIGNPARVSLGDDIDIAAGCTFTSEVPDGSLRVGCGVQFNDHCEIDFSGGLDIGEDCLFSTGVLLYSHDHGHDPRSAPVALPKLVGRGVWIGARAVIMPSCRSIGDGAIVGAGAIVVKDVPAGAIVAGNPARPIAKTKLTDLAS